ncbi:hypothetical protein ACMAUO_12110 [Gluconacetobacter sp. Hr-1-5]|uniref:hypothetical protein n=1 Tax=Gluconacetobacter sp. Hr-1-5 TaxID=3395370 RepID=UPI003B526BA7
MYQQNNGFYPVEKRMFFQPLIETGSESDMVSAIGHRQMICQEKTKWMAALTLFSQALTKSEGRPARGRMTGMPCSRLKIEHLAYVLPIAMPESGF